MIEITHFNLDLAGQPPETQAILLAAHLNVHDAVDRITLHGSRGPKGGARPDSDIDLCLVINTSALAAARNPDSFLRTVLNTTLQNWRSVIEPDLAAVFDKSGCGLHCFNQSNFSPGLCPSTAGCLGVFKTQKGFDGFVSGSAVDCGKMYPLITIWTRERKTAQPIHSPER